jgi:hypothetical protein
MGVILLASLVEAAEPQQPFPDPRPLTRVEAASLLVGPAANPELLNARIREILERPAGVGSDAARRRALEMLLARPVLRGEQVWPADDGTPVHYTLAEGSTNRVSPFDGDRDGLPEQVQAVGRGLSEARALLVDRIGLPPPQALEVFLVDLGGRFDGYLIPADRRGRGPTAVLDAAGGGRRDGDSRRAAIRHYARAVALSAGLGLDGGWSDALAHWSVLAIDGRPDDRAAALIALRLRRLEAGLLTTDPALAAGNAIWLAFLYEAYGPGAVRATVDELSRGGRSTAMVDRALRRSTVDDLAAAFREFHLWAILTGGRADAHHFPFAAQLPPPRFASTSAGLPALSVQADAPLSGLGAAQVLIRPEASDGGLRIRFEGEFAARWEADLLVVGRDGSLRRLPLELEEGQGEIAIPLSAVSEVVLLTRNLGSDDGHARHYTYAAHGERGYPFEIGLLDAVSDRLGGGVAVTWETLSEQELIGFNVLRSRETGGRVVTVNSVWIPALGNETDATSYFFLDPSAEPGIAYRYRIEGITRHGMTSSSDAISVRPPLDPR